MTALTGDAPLTELCAICHVEPLKYTCPRCNIHTCSLPCVKRHKQWARCSGIRDPAAYRKRAELATEASMDQDFNFITKVERSLQRADDDVLDKGIQLAPAFAKPRGLGARTKFDIEVEAREIRLVRTPQGLSRSKHNKSHWAGPQKGIMWTLEWLCEGKDRRLANVSETKSVGEAFTACFGKKVMRRKRKRLDEDVQPGDIHPTADTLHEEPNVLLSSEQHQTTKGSPSARDSNIAGDQENEPTNMDERVLCKIPEDVYFYIHRPLIRSKLKCLIPIAGSETLQKALRGKTLLDFPTIVVRKEKPDELPEPFILEGAYDEAAEEASVELPALATASVPPSIIRETNTVDEKQVLAVLEKDLNH